MQKRCVNKIALVTGAGTGIGRAVAQRLAEEGAKVFILGRTEQTLRETAGLHTNINYVVADIEKEEDINRVFSGIQETYGRLDILVNNAGWAPVTPFEQVTMKEYDKVFSINVRALVAVTRQALPFLTRTKGTIINMSSVICLHRLANMSMYAGTKAAVEMFTKIWAKELAVKGIRVNAIGVGSIETPIYGKTDLSSEDMQAHIDRITKEIPQGHFGTPADIANVTAFLASEEAKFVTGAVYAVDGGLSI